MGGLKEGGGMVGRVRFVSPQRLVGLGPAEATGRPQQQTPPRPTGGSAAARRAVAGKVLLPKYLVKYWSKSQTGQILELAKSRASMDSW